MVDLLGIFGFLVVLLRAATMCLQSVCIGGILFLTFIAPNRVHRNENLQRSAWKLIRGTALGLAASHLLFVITNTLVLRATVEIPLSEVLGANYVLAGGLGIVAGTVIALWPEKWRNSFAPIALVPAAGMLAASVMTSHSASRVEDRLALVALTVVHYLATASWIGGLPYLLLALTYLSSGEAKTRIVRRFSHLALGSVASLVVAGAGMSWVYIGSVAAIYGTAYGVMVVTKVILLLCLMVLGAANYFIVKGLGHPASSSGAGLSSLRRFGEVEIGIGLTIILAAASLTSQPPGADLPQDRVTLHEIAARFKPRTPRFSSPPLSELSEPTNQMYKKAEAAGHSLPPAYVPGQTAWHPDKPSDIEWSEYNHNWAGLIVLFMGLLALLSRSRYFAWAKIWPLVFLGLALFLFLRADPENWPLGPNGFWASFGVADVLQHRAAVILIVLFAIFQYRVETKSLNSMAAALVFPAVCALGGVVLLTHTHALGNIKEEMLTELSHTPLAIFGIIAGWSRWLELRLPEENPTRKYLAWIWPVCFIFVGLILLNYRETTPGLVTQAMSGISAR